MHSGSFAIALATISTALLFTVSAVEVTYTNKHYYYFDIDGNAIDSTNGKVQWVKDQYFWISEPDSCGAPVCDKISYSSPDLTNWYYNGPLFNLTANLEYCSGFGSCSRPKVVYNEKTQKYVFYGFASPIGGPISIPVFTSDFLTHGYTFVGKMIPAYGPSGYGVEDLGLAVIDGIGYVVFTSFNITQTVLSPPLSSIWPPFIQTVMVQQLSDDFLSGVGNAYPVIEAGGDFPVIPTSKNLLDGEVESPDLFKRDNYYYMVGSGTCAFCPGTLTVAYMSTSPFGPWQRQIIDNSNTCGGQAMGVMTIPPLSGARSNTYVFHADEFHTAPVGQHFTASKGHSFWPLSFNADGTIQPIDCSPNTSFTFHAPPASATIPTIGRATNVTDGSGNNGDYWSETGLLDQRYLYQTWASSKSGTLTEIGVNLACNTPTANPLAITVFRYENEAQFLSPFFNWEVLATLVIGQTAAGVTPGFKVQRVPVNKAVQRGDRLGIALTFPGALPATTVLPYAYLLQNTTGTGTNHVLYSLPRGHVSLSGLGGSESPILTLENLEIKWYASVI